MGQRLSWPFVTLVSFSLLRTEYTFFFSRMNNGPNHTVWEERGNEPISRDDRKRTKPIQEITDLSEVMQNIRPCECFCSVYLTLQRVVPLVGTVVSTRKENFSLVGGKKGRSLLARSTVQMTTSRMGQLPI